MHTIKILLKVPCILLILFGLAISCKKEPTLDSDLEEQFYFKNDKSRMPVWIHGNSKSKVFIINCHGGPGLGRGLELRAGVYAEKLEEKYAMVYWDQRAQGSSQGHLNKSDVSIDHMVEDIHTLIGVLKGKYGQDISVFLMGHSWGGTLSTAYLIKSDYQHELKGWINTSGTPDSELEKTESAKTILLVGSENIAAGNDVSDWQNIVKEVSKIDTTKTSLNDADMKILFKQEKAADKLFKKEINASQLKIKGIGSLGNPDPGALLLLSSTGQLLVRHFWKEIAEISMTNDLEKIVIPSLIQGGRYDLGPTKSVMESVYNKIGADSKYLRIYDHSGHASFETEPDLFVNNVIDFIELHK